MKRILVIEDEPGLQMSLEDNLIDEGFEASVRADGISGEAAAMETEWDCIILDVMLPGKNGFDVCRYLRQKGKKTPILMLTARTLVMDRVMGLELGADDYLMKPFDNLELVARIKALLRRGEYRGKVPAPQFKFGDFLLDTKQAQLTKNEMPIALHTREYLLLQYLCRNANRLISRDELLDHVWGYDSVATTRTVDVHIGWLRKKLEEQREHRHILTLRGLGYRFQP